MLFWTRPPRHRYIKLKASDKHRKQSTMWKKLLNEKMFANYQLHLAKD